jgi:uncharacterized protein (TIGR03435 family)
VSILNDNSLDMTKDYSRKLNSIKKLLLTGVVAIAGLIAFAQESNAPAAPTAPVFDVASIKVNKTADEHAHSHIYSSPNNGQFTAMNVPLRMLMAFSFDVPESRIVGGPHWLDSIKFDMEAKADSFVDDQLHGLTSDQAKLRKQKMLQALLADRFQRSTHTESRELPIYTLVVTKGGAKLKPNVSGRYVGTGRDHITVQGGDSVAVLADRLGQQVGRVVVDKTGITGSYDLSLKWTPDVDAAPGTPPADSGPSIFTALQEQLGLKLESGKGPVLVLVIDRIEMPSQN